MKHYCNLQLAHLQETAAALQPQLWLQNFGANLFSGDSYHPESAYLGCKTGVICNFDNCKAGEKRKIA